MIDTRDNATIALVGLGYVGLPTALSLLNKSMRVIGFDVSEQRLDAIRSGDVDLIPSDRERLATFAGSSAFVMTTDPAYLQKAEVVIICVPTPVDDDHNPDLRAISGACRTVVESAQIGQTFVLTSTTYVGCTNDMLVEPLSNRGFTVGEDVHVVFSPERIDPGNTINVQEMVPRVIGGYTHKCALAAARTIRQVAPTVHVVDSLEVAELSKLYENTFRAVNIALINELSEIASSLGINITEVVKAASTKPYGFMTFWPGPGVGGHCIPCDPYYLSRRLNGVGAPVISASMRAIARRPSVIVESTAKALRQHGIDVAEASICVIGVAFKPNVADVRETPASAIIGQLTKRGANISYFDPLVPDFQVKGNSVPTAEPDGSKYDAVLVLTMHDDGNYSWLNSHPLIIDATYRSGLPGAILP